MVEGRTRGDRRAEHSFTKDASWSTERATSERLASLKMENGREGGVGSGMSSETSVEAGDTEEWSGEHV